MSEVIIRYTWPAVNDGYICRRSSGIPGGCWRNGVEGRRAALRFRDEGCARSYLALHNYDLPPLKVTFERVDSQNVELPG